MHFIDIYSYDTKHLAYESWPNVSWHDTSKMSKLNNSDTKLLKDQTWIAQSGPSGSLTAGPKQLLLPIIKEAQGKRIMRAIIHLWFLKLQQNPFIFPLLLLSSNPNSAFFQLMIFS